MNMLHPKPEVCLLGAAKLYANSIVLLIKADVAHSYSQIVKQEEMECLAQQCGILDQKQIDLALQFFHDTGTIIWLSEHSLLCLLVYSVNVILK